MDAADPVRRAAEAQAWLPELTLRASLPLSEQVYAHLRAAIVTGRVPPSVGLNEPSIARHCGVSRTPVREALLRLRDDGLVEIKRQSGTFVAPIDPSRVEEGMIVREALEPRMAAIAAGRIDSRVLLDLVFETERMAEAVGAGDNRGFIEADDRFHRLLVDASGFLHIAEIIARVNAQLDRVRYLSALEPARTAVALEEHRTLIERLRAGDADGASRALADHLESSWTVIRELLVRQSVA